MGLNVESLNMKSLFQLLDFDGTGQVTLDNFVMGIQMMHGNAKSTLQQRRSNCSYTSCLAYAIMHLNPISIYKWGGPGLGPGWQKVLLRAGFRLQKCFSELFA